MAIIKCPECGHQISDKAPVCPSCGVEIAGKITRCSYCGEIYLKGDIVCPHCHKATGGTTSDNTNIRQGGRQATSLDPAMTLTRSTSENTRNGLNDGINNNKAQKNANGNPAKGDDDGNNNNKKNRSTLIISILISLIVVGVCYYKYNSAQGNKEREEYEFAMKSDDPMILQTYLNNFKDAPKEHIDSISAHLKRLTQQDKDWSDALIRGSKSALNNFLETYPDSPHRQEALDKIDSIDWEQCKKMNVMELYQAYIENHADGMHYDEAVLALKSIKAEQVSTDEREGISNVFHRFFVSINSKDENGLTSTVNNLVNFLGKQGATKSDIISFMHKLYKSDVRNMIWTLANDYNIQKKDNGDDTYEYTVSFKAKQDVEKTDNSKHSTNFKINAKVNSEGKITDFSMTKIIE